MNVHSLRLYSRLYRPVDAFVCGLILEMLNWGGGTASSTCLDMSAAFDTVNHQIMFDVLHHRFDIRDDALTWFHSYFDERSQVVSVGFDTSAVMKLLTGVPQGSVLGPRSFVYYAEDVQEIFEREEVMYHLFADDMQGHRSSQPQNAAMIVASLQDCVVAVSKWCASKRLQLNAKKTELLWFGSVIELRKVDPALRCLTVGTDVIQPVDVVRDLGVYFEFSSHDESTRGPSCQDLLLPSSSSTIDTTKSWTRCDRHDLFQH